MNSPTLYVGIDNGLTGAIVILSDHPGPPIAMRTMPTRGKAKGNEVDAAEVMRWITMETSGQQVCVTLETPGKHSPGVQALCSMWDSYGALRTICEVKGWRHHRIAPQAWQKVMLLGCAKGDTKPAALAMARRLWPDETWIATPRSSVPHTGLIDAALIAEFARRSRL